MHSDLTNQAPGLTAFGSAFVNVSISWDPTLHIFHVSRSIHCPLCELWSRFFCVCVYFRQNPYLTSGIYTDYFPYVMFVFDIHRIAFQLFSFCFPSWEIKWLCIFGTEKKLDAKCLKMTERQNTNSIDHGTPIWIHNTVWMNSPFPLQPNSIRISLRSLRISRFFADFPSANNSSQIFRITDISPSCANLNMKMQGCTNKLVDWTRRQNNTPENQWLSVFLPMGFSIDSRNNATETDKFSGKWHYATCAPHFWFKPNEIFSWVMINVRETSRSWRKPGFARECPKLYIKLEREGRERRGNWENLPRRGNIRGRLDPETTTALSRRTGPTPRPRWVSSSLS